MTQRLYYTDSYLREFDATVVDRADEGRMVFLDRTAFYPTSGGQPNDLGRLSGERVIDVVDQGDRIAHRLARPLQVAGDNLKGEIDWSRRFDHMQQHTGQHLLSAVIAELFGYQTVSVHFGEMSSTLDLDTGVFSYDQLVAAEARANEVAVEDRPVHVTFELAESAAGLRKPSERQGTLRIVSIEDLDRSACGGTHVRSTGEVGPILLRKVERVKQSARLEFLCGARAVRQARADGDLLARLAAGFSAAADELPALVERLRADLKEAAAARRSLERQLAHFQARELYRAATPDGRGVRVVVMREQEGPVEQLRALAQATAALPRAMFVGVVSHPPTLLVAASEDSGIDAGRLLRAGVEPVGGRGGGSARMAQGSVKDPAVLDGVIAALMSG
jgi:alanyl-tRNA synthetase